MGNEYITDIDRVLSLPEDERKSLKGITEKYAFRSNEYYLSLINWDDPDDPIRKIIIPDPSELEAWGALDASNEAANYVVPGCQHKYPRTALILVNEMCGGFCRFCFRKRLFGQVSSEVSHDISEAIEYIRRRKQITNVLLTGGDALMMPSAKLDDALRQIRGIGHVKVIRIGSKMPAFNPSRIIDDPELPSIIARYSTRERRIYVMAHFNHPRELTNKALSALDILMKAGAIIAAQTPILRGINHDPETLANLMRELSAVGAPPYYFFQCRPTAGNKAYAVPIVETYINLEKAKSQVSGLAKRAKYVMSHSSGKIEVVGLTEDRIYLRYHRARWPRDESRFLVFRRDDRAYWFDDLRQVSEPVREHAVLQQYKSYGPE